ncbi:MAG TPA: TIGR02281 family clan AA aspartic protease [Methylomirabilota bacterium]|jgi:clan AA aspartic protease (TIGR02281 family)
MSRSTAVVAALLALALVDPVQAARSVAELNEAGKAAYSRGDFAAAERLFNQAIAEAPEEPLLHYHRGITLMRRSRWAEAAAAFQSALRLDPPADVAAAARAGLRTLDPLLNRPAPRAARPDETTVTLQRLGGNWFAQVRLNDARVARFLIDTGASTCVISPTLAAALDIRPDRHAKPVPLQTISGLTRGQPVTIPSLRVGDVEVEDVIAVVHPLGASMDGILGNTFLARFTVTLDPARGLLRLGPK